MEAIAREMSQSAVSSNKKSWQALTSTAADNNGGTSSPDINSDVCASDQVQFNLLYRSLHIYGVLGKRQTGESYYKVERTLIWAWL